jgi:hypothetical protein
MKGTASTLANTTKDQSERIEGEDGK